ncbi:hypothetical protein [Paraburkholderia agricolaris]|nr:hypothetical protein [Paraburkholderia agricolaris]
MAVQQTGKEQVGGGAAIVKVGELARKYREAVRNPESGLHEYRLA